jgi:hypothetical protein
MHQLVGLGILGFLRKCIGHGGDFLWSHESETPFSCGLMNYIDTTRFAYVYTTQVNGTLPLWRLEGTDPQTGTVYHTTLRATTPVLTVGTITYIPDGSFTSALNQTALLGYV